MKLSPAKQKILLLLLGGLTLGVTYNPRRQLRIIKEVARAWKEIDEKKLNNEIALLYRQKMVSLKENPDGGFEMVLSEKGKLKAINYHFEKTKIEPSSWDGKWRLVVFDVPEKLRQGRDALREKLRRLGFRELQKSVFVFPYDCRDEIEFLVEFFALRKYVRYGVLELIDNDLHLQKEFGLI